MNEIVKTGTCERGDDLVSFLYGEISEPEAQDFETHLQLCRECSTEIASFREVRESVNLWKQEVLGGFVSPRVFAQRKKSALAAFQEFFALSPFWLKGAVGFAAVLFLAMVTSLAVSYKQPQNIPTVATTGKEFSQEDLKRAVATALEEQRAKSVVDTNIPHNQERISQTTTEPLKNRETKSVNKATQWVRRSLSKSEREQLAADLRLTSAADEENLNLLGERINQEY